MTLDQWCEANNVGARVFEKEGYDRMMTVADRTYTPDARWELFHLDDYVVTSVEAGTVWLAKRKETSS